jgi:hypothetical protein
MKQFDKIYRKFLVLYEMNTHPIDIREGDVVTFTKGWNKHPYIQSLGANSTTVQRIEEMCNSKNNLVVNQLRTQPPTTYGGLGSMNDNGGDIEGALYVTVAEQYSDGLHKNIVVVPLSIIQKVELNNNLPPVSDEQEIKHSSSGATEPAPDANDPNNTHPSYRNRKDKGINKELNKK